MSPIKPSDQNNDYLYCSDEIAEAIVNRKPIVALETAVVSHGLPQPINIDVAQAMEAVVRRNRGIPATIGVIKGKVKIGLNLEDLYEIGSGTQVVKIGSRDLAVVISRGYSGGTTVSASIMIAEKLGIKVFATGGIGGVHRHNPFDISTDLWQLSKTPIIVVCSGSKSILDLPATLEYLETMSVPVLGFQTDEFPAFLTSKSGLRTQISVNSVDEVIDIARAHWEMGSQSSVIIAVPPPADKSLKADDLEHAIRQALAKAEKNGVRGKDVTPYLLDQISLFTDGASVDANTSLLKNNAEVASSIANAIVG